MTIDHPASAAVSDTLSALQVLDQLRVDVDSPRPIYQQIIDGIQRAVARRALHPGDRLPSQRDLAQAIRVNPNTVQRAFREMEVLGMIETVRGQGTFLRNDPTLVERFRTDMARAAVEHFVREMRSLGFEAPQALELVQHAFRHPETGAPDEGSSLLWK